MHLTNSTHRKIKLAIGLLTSLLILPPNSVAQSSESQKLALNQSIISHFASSPEMAQALIKQADFSMLMGREKRNSILIVQNPLTEPEPATIQDSLRVMMNYSAATGQPYTLISLEVFDWMARVDRSRSASDYLFEAIGKEIINNPGHMHIGINIPASPHDLKIANEQLLDLMTAIDDGAFHHAGLNYVLKNVDFLLFTTPFVNSASAPLSGRESPTVLRKILEQQGLPTLVLSHVSAVVAQVSGCPSALN